MACILLSPFLRVYTNTVIFNFMSSRYKCVACFKEYKQHEHLVEHMKKSYHSVHQPRCSVCGKYCKSFESLREHISGKLAKAQCSSIFSLKGCEVCLKVFPDPYALREHQESCILTPPAPIVSRSQLAFNRVHVFK